MKQITLYLLLGYPGAGKTTLSKLIARETDAVHLWADAQRHETFDRPTHSHQENLELYDQLNTETEKLLAGGKSVIFDTSFNLYDDRQKLREIAKRQGAETVVVWLATPREIAKKRAVHSIITRNGYEESMDEQRFETLANKLEPPRTDEKVIKIDGTKLDANEVMRLISS